VSLLSDSFSLFVLPSLLLSRNFSASISFRRNTNSGCFAMTSFVTFCRTTHTLVGEEGRTGVLMTLFLRRISLAGVSLPCCVFCGITSTRFEMVTLRPESGLDVGLSKSSCLKSSSNSSTMVGIGLLLCFGIVTDKQVTHAPRPLMLQLTSPQLIPQQNNSHTIVQ
jgi:hypothetical protein